MYAAFVMMILFSIAVCLSPKAQAEEIEEVVVVAQQTKTVKTDPLKENSFIQALLPGHTWTAGGQGAFQGYNERGAQTVHTAVYRNGIPANLPGTAWYDFGTELVTGQKVKIISGANSVVYGSGSIAGTILIKDVIENIKNDFVSDGNGVFGPTESELPDRLWRADPVDGLRPFKEIRKNYE